MLEIISDINKLLSSPEHTQRPFIKALRNLASKPHHVNKISSENGFSPSETEFYNNIYQKKASTNVEIKDSIVLVDGKAVSCDAITCKIFQLISKHFFIKDIESLMLLFKDKLLFVHGEQNSHNFQKCHCAAKIDSKVCNQR